MYLKNPEFYVSTRTGLYSLKGEVIGSLNYPDNEGIRVSCPVSYDVVTKTLKTQEGSEYILIEPSYEVEQEIYRCIERGRYTFPNGDFDL